MSSKFSQVRNKRQKPPHCRPGTVYPAPYLPYQPDHLYCHIIHKFQAWGTEWNFRFHLWEHIPPSISDFEWWRLNNYDSIEYLQYIVLLDSNDNFQTFELSLTIDGAWGGNYLSKIWTNQQPTRQFPLKTQLLQAKSSQAGTQNLVTIQVIDTGKPYPPPIPGNYGPY